MRYLNCLAKKIFSSRKNGFTLVELLIVISIIAILSVVGVTVFSGIQKKARIVKRISDIKAVQTSLEVYYYTHNSQYPISSGWNSECTTWGGDSSDQVIPGLVPDYMTSFPHDPLYKANDRYCYLYQSNGTDYMFIIMRIDELNSAELLQHPELILPHYDGGAENTTGWCSIDGTGPFAWGVYTPGAKCW